MKNALTCTQRLELSQVIMSWLSLPADNNGYLPTSKGNIHFAFLYDLMCLETGFSIDLNPHTLPESEKTTFGEKIAELLKLRKNSNDRYDMYGGDKTPLGLFLTLHHRFNLHLCGKGQIIETELAGA